MRILSKIIKNLLHSGTLRDLSDFPILHRRIFTFISLIVVFLHIYFIVILFPDPIFFRAFHASVFVCFAIYLYSPDRNSHKKVSIFDYILIGICLANFFYIYANLKRFILRTDFFDPILPFDLFFGIAFILILIEAGRRILGWPMILLSILFFIYSFFGNYIPGYFTHAGLSIDRIIEVQYLTTLGMFGFITGISATYVFMFILFGSYLRYCGASDFFFSLGNKVSGAARGGAAKTAVIASAFFSMISGSANANVATTGSFTIPMMIKLGYRKEFAGAVEAAASSVGTVTPPVMGAVAFLMSEFIGIPYNKIIIVAAVPAIVYYVSIFTGIDREAIRQDLKPIKMKDSPSLFNIFIKGLPFIIPAIYLVYRIFRGIPVALCAFEATLVILFCSFINIIFTKNKGKISIKTYIEASENIIESMAPVAIACVLAGVIIGNIHLTGVGIKFSSMLISFAHGNLLLLLILTAILTIILGMGIPMSPAYILVISLASPALIEAGIPKLNAHFFIAWYAALSTITPPVCISTYMAASIAKVKDPLKVGWIAVKLASGGFLVPILFVYRPELLLTGPLINSVITFTFTIIGVFSIITFLFGKFIYKSYNLFEKIIVIIASIMLFFPNYIINVFGFILFSIIFILQYKSRNKAIS